jgi:hypothetical protein
MSHRHAAFAAVVALLLPLGVPASAAPRTSRQCTLSDRRIDEASGIAQGIRSPGVFYVQNDSGDSARFFAIDTHTCDTAATVHVTGARNVDWEDIAVARDAAGTPSVWIGDIGDNDAKRPEVDIYRVDEPKVRAGGPATDISVRAADEWRLRYPSGAVNAESLAVTPDGTAYVITKALLGLSTVYRVPPTPSRTRVQELRSVGSIAFALTGTRNPFGAAGELTATGAAISPDGSVLAVRTYSDAYLWRVRNGDVAAAIRTRPARIALPEQPQGEGIAFFGARSDRLVLDSEHIATAVYSVAVPPLGAAAPPTRSSAGSAKPSSPTSGSVSPSPSSSSGPKSAGGHGAGGWLTGIVVLSLLALLAAAFWIAQLTGGRRGR